MSHKIALSKPDTVLHDNLQTSFLDKCIKDDSGKLAIGQTPNLPLLIWLLAKISSWLLSGELQKGARAVAFGALFTWAWLELFQGTNYFRRLLGSMIMIILIVSAAQ